MLVLKVIFWASLAALVWTHALYPVFVAVLARLRPRPARSDDSYRPRVALDEGLARFVAWYRGRYVA